MTARGRERGVWSDRKLEEVTASKEVQKCLRRPASLTASYCLLFADDNSRFVLCIVATGTGTGICSHLYFCPTISQPSSTWLAGHHVIKNCYWVSTLFSAPTSNKKTHACMSDDATASIQLVTLRKGQHTRALHELR